MKHLTDIFTKTELAGMSLSFKDAAAPPATYYTSADLYELERERIFLKEWLWVGHAAQVAKPGDYFTFEVAEEPIVVVRDLTNKLGAFSPVCAHRGAIVVQGQGNCRSFMCPYHNWTYGLNGKLIGAPTMNETKNFDPTKHGLTPLKVDIWEGHVFVNFDQNCKSLATFLGDITRFVKNYNMGNLACTGRKEYDFPCNWKMVAENNLEGYHVTGTHGGAGEYSKIDHWSIIEGRGMYDILLGEFDEPLSMNVPGNASAPTSMISDLTEVEQKRQYFILLYPNMLLALQPDSTICYVMLPQGPHHTKVIVDWHYPKSILDRPDFATIDKANVEGVDGFNDQDIRVLGLAAKGYKSRMFRPGRYSVHESVVHRLAQYVLARIEGHDAWTAKGLSENQSASK
jgi:choline monooxygenase